MPEAVIVATARSPIGRAFKGSLVSLRPDDMAAQMSRPCWPRCRSSSRRRSRTSCSATPSRQGRPATTWPGSVALLAGLPAVPGTTVNRYCSSSLQTIRMAVHAIRAGEGRRVRGGRGRGGESLRPGHGRRHARHPQPAVQQAEDRSAARSLGGNEPWTPAIGLADIYIAMGQTAENVRELERVSREDMDRFSVRSQERAVASQENGFFEREITPLTLDDGTEVRTDDGPRPGTTLERLAELKPAFRPDGEVTAGNSCPLNDGAAAVIVMSDTRARDLGITPLARVLSSGLTALDPEIMGLGPMEACRQALRRAHLTIADMDLVEINEAFAAQVVPSARHLGIDMEKLNVHGGAIALGHPFGMTGARIMTTLINGLQSEDKSIGLESMCVGGGQGMAMIIERLS